MTSLRLGGRNALRMARCQAPLKDGRPCGAIPADSRRWGRDWLLLPREGFANTRKARSAGSTDSGSHSSAPGSCLAFATTAKRTAAIDAGKPPSSATPARHWFSRAGETRIFEGGGDEDEAIAELLHDVVEDQCFRVGGGGRLYTDDRERPQACPSKSFSPVCWRASLQPVLVSAATTIKGGDCGHHRDQELRFAG